MFLVDVCTKYISNAWLLPVICCDIQNQSEKHLKFKNKIRFALLCEHLLLNCIFTSSAEDFAHSRKKIVLIYCRFRSHGCTYCFLVKKRSLHSPSYDKCCRALSPGLEVEWAGSGRRATRQTRRTGFQPQLPDVPGSHWETKDDERAVFWHNLKIRPNILPDHCLQSVPFHLGDKTPFMNAAFTHNY